jgi:hypothetical protein
MRKLPNLPSIELRGLAEQLDVRHLFAVDLRRPLHQAVVIDPVRLDEKLLPLRAMGLRLVDFAQTGEMPGGAFCLSREVIWQLFTYSLWA